MSSAPGIAIPGSSVPASSPVAPGGAQGIQGIQGAKGPPPYTVTTADFTMPAPGSSVIVNVQDASWIIVGEMLTVQTAGGNPTTAASLRCTAKSGNQLTLLYQPPTTIPLASTTQAGLLGPISGNSTDYVGGDNIPHDLGGVITSVRLRSFNAVGNPNAEVCQRNISNLLTNPANNAFLEDRWSIPNGGLQFTAQRVPTAASAILVPGTNFAISNAFFRFTLSTQKTSLAATDLLALRQTIEGPNLRELYNDVHSISLLVRSSIAGLSFGLVLSDTPGTRSLAKLCTLGAANTVTLITLPNLPNFPSGGNFVSTPGSAGYLLQIVLCAGSGNQPPANDTWQTFFQGALGQGNFAAGPVNSTFDIAFVQHEPGPVCTTLIDKPFSQNYDECLRYFQKTYSYGTPIGPAYAGGISILTQTGTAAILGSIKFTKPMAKIPTISEWNHSTGAANSFYHSNGTSYGITSATSVGDTGFGGFNTATLPAVVAGALGYVHYTADTGW